MKRIGTLKQTIAGLVSLFGNEILGDELRELVDGKPCVRQPGFTKACRTILMAADGPLGLREVCERLQEKMPAVLQRHKDPKASLNTVLNRLVEYGEAESMMQENGRRAWYWLSGPDKPVSLPVSAGENAATPGLERSRSRQRTLHSVPLPQKITRRDRRRTSSKPTSKTLIT
jgi:hypothetical protein